MDKANFYQVSEMGVSGRDSQSSGRLAWPVSGCRNEPDAYGLQTVVSRALGRTLGPGFFLPTGFSLSTCLFSPIAPAACPGQRPTDSGVLKLRRMKVDIISHLGYNARRRNNALSI
jgi:hypothetical protein